MACSSLESSHSGELSEGFRLWVAAVEKACVLPGIPQKQMEHLTPLCSSLVDPRQDRVALSWLLHLKKDLTEPDKVQKRAVKVIRGSECLPKALSIWNSLAWQKGVGGSMTEVQKVDRRFFPPGTGPFGEPDWKEI